MKWIKLYEDFKVNNEEGSLISEDDIIEVIKKGGVIYATIIHNLPNNDPKSQLKPVDIQDGSITVLYDGGEYTVDLNDVEKIEF